MMKLDSRSPAVTKRSLSSSSNNYIRFDIVSVRKLDIEVDCHSYFNPGSGWAVPTRLKIILHRASVVSVDETVESNVVNVVCN